MADADADAGDVRRIALALPGVEEIPSDGFDFRVAGRGFIWSYPESVPGRRRRIRSDIAVLFVGDEAEKQALLLGAGRVQARGWHAANDQTRAYRGRKMASEACSICGEEADADELDPHGHFSSDDDTCAICGDAHFVVGNKPDHEWANGI